MNKKKFDRINAKATHSTNYKPKEDVLLVAPEDYRDLKDVSDDYDLTAKILHKQTIKELREKIEQGLNSEEESPYGPATNYKGRYSYNRDD